MREKWKRIPEYEAQLSQSLNSKAWHGFFLGEFSQVEADIREALALKTENKYLLTSLAPALLLQGKFEAAQKAYFQYKDQEFGEQGLNTYRDAFLDDLKAFEAAGIIPPERMREVERIRELLGE